MFLLWRCFFDSNSPPLVPSKWLFPFTPYSSSYQTPRSSSIVVAGTVSAVSTKFEAFSKVGGIIGSSVSAAFLILLGLMNVHILYKLVEQMRILIKMEEGEEQGFRIKGAGCLFGVLRRLFKVVDR